MLTDLRKKAASTITTTGQKRPKKIQKKARQPKPSNGKKKLIQAGRATTATSTITGNNTGNKKNAKTVLVMKGSQRKFQAAPSLSRASTAASTTAGTPIRKTVTGGSTSNVTGKATVTPKKMLTEANLKDNYAHSNVTTSTNTLSPSLIPNRNGEGGKTLVRSNSSLSVSSTISTTSTASKKKKKVGSGPSASVSATKRQQ
jgi:hypothetical protein